MVYEKFLFTLTVKRNFSFSKTSPSPAPLPSALRADPYFAPDKSNLVEKCEFLRLGEFLAPAPGAFVVFRESFFNRTFG